MQGTIFSYDGGNSAVDGRTLMQSKVTYMAAAFGEGVPCTCGVWAEHAG